MEKLKNSQLWGDIGCKLNKMRKIVSVGEYHISLRLHDREMNILTELALSERKDKSSIARELIDHGWEFVTQWAPLPKNWNVMDI